ncbi:putative LRR receptor-like serine/threonine-protein kinase MRH1 [Platanthera guangdongensis]|uniref:LRR receptor-like serine/threonine-protein kinase MRH1 n=1 Tax=Platanthera guangdongensis TaxID=2320717 RepID=A0ABR2LZ40_9ASPA
MERRRMWIGSLLRLIVTLCFQGPSFCDSTEAAEGEALLRFKERIDFDPYGALSNWGKPGVDHCLWYGVYCSEDGKVVSLNLSDLCLEGALTSEIKKLVNLKSLVLHNNSFFGTIPGEIVELSKLEVLDLGQNNFSGSFPSKLLGLNSLKILVIGNNRFDIPSEIGEFTIVSEFEVNEEMLCSNRVSLLRYSEMANIRRLLQKNINHRSKHHTHGRHHHTRAPIFPSPSPSPSPSLSVSLSPSPSPSPVSSVITSQSPISTNPHSHSPVGSPSPAPSPEKSISPLASPSSLSFHTSNFQSEPAPTNAKGTQKKTQLAVYVSIGAGLFVLAASALIYFLFFRNNRVVSVMPWKTGLSGQLQKALVTGVPSLKRSELEAACEYFSNIIGTVSGCSFYKGTLSSGVEIAVTSTFIKSSKDWSDKSEVLFREKISVLSRVNHKNFMNLIGHCTEQEPFTRMMVFEYASNGTLFEHLHIKEAEPLDWTTRLRIAMGIAYCLEHMQRLDPPVIPRNLNSSTVYLTEDYAAKISDLSFWNEERESYSSYEVPDDLEPPLSNQEEIVYKFGIILLELISGRLPFSKDDGLLVLWASSYLTGKRPLNGIVDLTLKLVSDKDITALCDVIRPCVSPDPRARPTMVDLVAQLRKITSMNPDAASPKLSPLWWAELEIISSEST